MRLITGILFTALIAIPVMQVSSDTRADHHLRYIWKSVDPFPQMSKQRRSLTPPIFERIKAKIG